jgi:hypothetical protein
MAASVAVRTFVCCSLLAAVVGASTSSAQQPVRSGPPNQAPPRDTSSRPATGTGVIRGHVVAADGNRPLRRVQIRATASGVTIGQPLTTSTDEAGEYELTNLPAGRYSISATRGGFLMLNYGQHRPRELGKLVDVANGQTVTSIDFAMPRMSVISGRVTDEDGDPIAGVNVLAMRSVFVAGRRQLVPVGDTRTMSDDAGEFRLGGLSPGTYIVSGRTGEKWSAGKNGSGEETMGYAPTYFPGTTHESEAARVVVGVGQDRGATDFSLIPGRAATVSGTALDAEGQPFLSVNLSLEVRGLEGGGSFASAGGATVGRDGSFVIRDVAPGGYVLSASRQDINPEVARLPIVVDGSDLTGLTLTGSAGGSVTGRVVVDVPGVAMPGVQISMSEPAIGQPDPGMLGAFRGRFTPVSPASDGSFVIHNVFGPTTLNVTLPDGWAVASMSQGGRGPADAPIVLRNGEQLTDVEVHLTNRVTTVTGTLTDDNGVPPDEGTVLVFPIERRRWFDGSRFVRAVRPDQSGRYQIKGLPPGDYFAVALEYVEDGAWGEPEYLDSIVKDATGFSLDTEQPRMLSLKLVMSR